MRTILLLLLAAVIFSCNGDCESSASCIGPPEGTFVDGELNLALGGNIVSKNTDGSYNTEALIDSIQVSDLLIKSFYTWYQVPNPVSITSITVYSEETEIVLQASDFFPINDGGYIATVIKTGDVYTVEGSIASQDLIDGVCNDVIGC